jgi:hypothetical protein
MHAEQAFSQNKNTRGFGSAGFRAVQNVGLTPSKNVQAKGEAVVQKS